MSLFDSAFATAKNLAKELGNGGVPAVHCGPKIRGEGFEVACTRSIRGCDPLVLCSWEEVNYRGVDTPNELGFIPDPSYRYDIHASHLHGYPTQKAEPITLHSNDLGPLTKILRNCRERAEESTMKNEKGKNVNEDHGSELLTVIDAVELADSLTKAGRPFYIDTDHEGKSGLDVWAVNSKTGEDYPRSWRVMDDLSVFVYNTDKNGNADVVEEKSFGNVRELGAWLAKEFTDLAGKSRESKGRRNERDDSYDKYTANVILQARKGSGATGLEYKDDDTYFIHIGIDELTKALREAGVPEALLDGEKVIPDINDALSYYDDIGQAAVETWYSPSQSFEDPGEGGSRATLDLNDKDRWRAVYGAIRAALQAYALGVLEIFGASNGNFIERGDYKEADIPGIMKEVEDSPELQDSLKEMNLTNADVETLLKAAIDPRTATAPGNLIIDLDGDADDNW